MVWFSSRETLFHKESSTGVEQILLSGSEIGGDLDDQVASVRDDLSMI